MQGMELRGVHGEQSSRAFASKAPKAFQRPDPADVIGGPMGLPFGLDDDMHMPAARMPDLAYMGRGPGIPRAQSEMGHRETSQLRDSFGGREALAREASGNMSMNASVQLPGLNHSLGGSLRGSYEGRPSKTEGGIRKSVLWALGDGQDPQRTMPGTANKLDASLRMSADGGMPRPDMDDDLQTQLNLLRERSWSEQQSLRRQLDDHKTEKERLKKELEGANVRVQELQNEAASIKDMFDVSAAIEKNGSATALIEEKNAQIRHLENLARELASGGGMGISLQAPSRELASGGGTLGALGMSALSGGKPSAKEQQLEQQLHALRAQRDKEQEDLKELEQVVVVFETKMEALKRENKDLKRQTTDLKSMHAQSMAAHVQSSKYHRPADTGNNAGNSVKLEQMIENMSILMCSLHDRNTALGSLIGSFCRWKTTVSTLRSENKNNTQADHRTALEYQLKKAGQKIATLKEEIETMVMRHTGLVESEQGQGAMMAQRMLKSEEAAIEKDKELAKLRTDVARLEQELDSSQRRLQSTSAMLCSGEHGASEAAQDQTTLLHALEDDIASLKIVRTNLGTRMAVMRKVGVAKAVRDKDRSCLMHKFQVWRMLPYLDKHVGTMVFQSNRGRNKVLKLKGFQQWFEQACLMSKSDLQEAEQGSKEQVDHLKSKLATEREAASSLSTSHKEASLRCERLSSEITSLKAQQQSLMHDLNSGAAGRRRIEKLQPSIHGLIEGVGKVKDEMDMLQTMFQCAVSENQGLRESMARLISERDTWFEERARIQQRQAAAAGGGSGAEANSTLMRDRCRIVTSKLDAAHLEISALQESMGDAKKTSDELQALAVQLQSTGLLFMHQGAPHIRTYDGDLESNPVARARLLAAEIRAFFQGMLQAFAEQGGLPGSDTGRLHNKVQELMKHLSETNDELQRTKQQSKQLMDARQQEIGMLSSSLTMTKNEVKYLQEIADGGSVGDVYTRSIKSMETFISSLNKKFSKKVAECQGLERHLNLLTRSNIDKSNAHDSLKQHMARLQKGDYDAPQPSASPSETELQMQLQERDRDLDIMRGKMQHCMDSSNALGSEVQELTALWRASANEVFNLNDAVAKSSAEMQGLHALSQNLRGQLKFSQDEVRSLNLTMDESLRIASSSKEEVDSCKDKASGLTRLLSQATAEKEALERRATQLQSSVSAISNKHAAEVEAREKVDNQLLEVRAAFERDGASLRSKVAAHASAAEATSTSMRSVCKDLQEGIQSLAVCISEQQRGHDLSESKMQGASSSNQTLTKRLQDCETALHNAQSESDRLQQDLVAMRAETDSLQDELHAQTGQNISSTKEMRKLTTHNENAELEMKKISDRCELQLIEISGLKQRYETAVATHEEESDHLRDKVKSQSAELAAHLKELAEEKQRVVVAQRTVHQLQEDVAGARTALDSINVGHAQLSEHVLQLREENHTHKIELEACSSQHSESHNQQAASLSKSLHELERLKADNQTVSSRVQRLDVELSGARHQLSRAVTETAELQESLDAQSNQTHAWLAKAQEMERTLSFKDAELTRFREAAEKTDALRHEAERSLLAVESTAGEELKLMLGERDKDRHDKTKLESERMYLQERLQALKAQLETAQEEVREREDMIQDIQKDAFMLQVQLLESLQCVKTRDSTLVCMETHFSTLTISLAHTRAECDIKLQLLDECRAQMDTKVQHLDMATAKCRALETKLQDLVHNHANSLAEMDKVVESARHETDSLRAKTQVCVDGWICVCVRMRVCVRVSVSVSLCVCVCV